MRWAANFNSSFFVFGICIPCCYYIFANVLLVPRILCYKEFNFFISSFYQALSCSSYYLFYFENQLAEQSSSTLV